MRCNVRETLTLLGLGKSVVSKVASLGATIYVRMQLNPSRVHRHQSRQYLHINSKYFSAQAQSGMFVTVVFHLHCHFGIPSRCQHCQQSALRAIFWFSTVKPRIHAFHGPCWCTLSSVGFVIKKNCGPSFHKQVPQDGSSCTSAGTPSFSRLRWEKGWWPPAP